MKTLDKLVLGASTLLFGCSSSQEYDTGFEPLVYISPENPTERDSLDCYVDTRAGSNFDFYWFVNREHVFSNYSTGAGFLDSVYVVSGDYVTCSAWVPSGAYFSGFEYGWDSTYID